MSPYLCGKLKHIPRRPTPLVRTIILRAFVFEGRVHTEYLEVLRRPYLVIVKQNAFQFVEQPALPAHDLANHPGLSGQAPDAKQAYGITRSQNLSAFSSNETVS